MTVNQIPARTTVYVRIW